MVSVICISQGVWRPQRRVGAVATVIKWVRKNCLYHFRRRCCRLHLFSSLHQHVHIKTTENHPSILNHPQSRRAQSTWRTLFFVQLTDYTHSAKMNRASGKVGWWVLGPPLHTLQSQLASEPPTHHPHMDSCVCQNECLAPSKSASLVTLALNHPNESE